MNNSKRNRRKSACAGAVLAFLLGLPMAAAAGPKTYEVVVGQSTLVPAASVTRVAVADGKLVKVEVLHDVGQVLLIGQQPGTTDLRVWSGPDKPRHYLVRVHDPLRAEAISDIRAELEGLEGIEMRKVGPNLIVSGRALRADDYRRVSALAERYPFVINNLPQPPVNLRSTVLLDVSVLEVRRNSLTQIGIDWSDAMQGPFFGFVDDIQTNDFFRGPVPDDFDVALPLDTGRSNAFFGIATQASSLINLLIQDGDARLLAEPKLTCVSGGTAEFLVGGEVPIPVTNEQGGINVIFKQFGIILEMEPVADADGYIDTRMAVEVSAVDASVSSEGFPGFSSRRADTRMNMRQGQTMVIAGLTNSEQSKVVDKVPLLGQIPILGELFKSRSFRDSQTELVVFVTPSLINPDSERNEQWLQQASDLGASAQERVRYSIWD